MSTLTASSARCATSFLGIVIIAVLCTLVGFAVGQEQAGKGAKHPIVFWEIATHDAPKTTAFLNEVFDWSDAHDAHSGIHFYGTEDDSTGPLPGGVFTLSKARLPFLTIYIAVDDLDAMVKKVEAAGGLIVIPPTTPTPGGSRICLFNEPSGVTLAMLERRKSPADGAEE